MSFSDLKGGQVACAKTFDRSIAVIAGAGSGKTFTLRERVAKAFDEHQEDGQTGPVVTDIGQVMAITFTEKAAAELRSRIKAALRETARPDQAVLVDDAWIGTIHGVCSRILRENAFELGLDPDFQIVPDDEWEALRRRAVEDAMSGISVSPDAVKALFIEYRPGNVVASIEALMDLAAQSPNGFADIVATPAPELRHLQQQVEDALGQRSRVALPPLPNMGADALSELHAWHEAVCALMDEALYGGVAAEGAGDGRGRGKTCPIPVQLHLELELALVWPFQSILLSLAADAVRRFDELKSARGQLDQDDLLSKAAAALERPEVAARYEDRFGLVMVDEFQDTDPLQLAIISRLSGPGNRRLCVVGDPQQSVYRFRGADVSTYNRHVGALPERSKIALDDNYRSHADILAFTDLVFTDAAGRPVGAYQRLNARRDESRKHYDEAVEGPRVSILDVRYPYGGKTAAVRRHAELVAQRFESIHEAGGRSYGDMAILLGAMTNVGEYAAALQRRGIPCVVAKGSVLSQMPEAKGVVLLARAIASREDAEAAFSVEESEFFGLSPADFVQMKAAGRGDGKAGGSAGDGVGRVGDAAGSDDGPGAGDGEHGEGCGLSERARAARRVIARARRRIGTVALSKLLVEVLHESGWVSRLEAQAESDPGRRAENHAKLANALKVVRMAEDIEAQRCSDAASVAAVLAQRMEVLREPPGALSAKDSNFVRIMTIHASKGLQFPIVAVAEFDGNGGNGGSSRIVSERMADDAGKVWQCAVLDPKASADRFEGSSWKCRSAANMLALTASEQEPISEERARRHIWPDDGRVPDAARFRAALVAYGQAADAAELERKLYVAFTRAEEALVVCTKAMVKKDGEVSVPAGVQSRIAEREAEIAARWEYRHDDVGAEKPDGRESGGQAGGQNGSDGEGAGTDGKPDAGAGDASAGEGGAGEFLVPCELPRRPRIDWPYRPVENADVFSASSLAAREGAEQPDAARRVVSRDARGLHRDDGEGDGRAAAPDAAAGHGGADGVCGKALRAAANVRGEALHACAQFAALHAAAGGPICTPPRDRLEAIAHAHGLSSEEDVAELAARMDAWTGSEAAEKVRAFAHLRCEEPFFICLDGEGGKDGGSAPYLRGFIDLLAYDEPGRGRAQVVDYKTGYLDMPACGRAEHFAMQARCYALAVLSQGFSRVELSFVFLDDANGAGDPQTVTFGPFTAQVEDDTARDADGAPCTRAWLCAKLRESIAGAAGAANADAAGAAAPLLHGGDGGDV